jgi:DNA-binding MarR family transcriptional regulator
VLDDAVQAVLTAYPAIHSACRRRQVRDPVSGRRLSDHQAGILEHLDPVTPVTVGDLASSLRVTPATVSIQLNQLARLRLVTRVRDEVDARRVHLRLTDAGARVRGARSLLDPDRVRAALQRLPTGEQDAVVAGVRLLARVASELPGDTARRPSPISRKTPKR